MRKENFWILSVAIICGLGLLAAAVALLYDIWFAVKLEMPVTGRAVLSAGVIGFIGLLVWLFIIAWKKPKPAKRYQYKRLWYSDINTADWAWKKWVSMGWQIHKPLQIRWHWGKFDYGFTFVVKREVTETPSGVAGGYTSISQLNRFDP